MDEDAEANRRAMFLGEESDFLSNLETNLNNAPTTGDLEADFLDSMTSELAGEAPLYITYMYGWIYYLLHCHPPPL